LNGLVCANSAAHLSGFDRNCLSNRIAVVSGKRRHQAQLHLLLQRALS
jgi:hypothetical protein